MESENVRRRVPNPAHDSQHNGAKSESRGKQFNKSKPNRHKPISPLQFLSFLCLIIIVLTGVVVVEKQLPVPLKINEEHKHPNRFIAERAYNHLRNLTALGSRIAGSPENDVLAVKLLRTEINRIVSNAKKNNIIEVDLQVVSGDFALKFLDGMTNVYRNLQNIIVKVGSHINSSHSLLINCHYDSVLDSPGASDDGAGCAVMLEMLRIISRSDQILRHNIIFLFNGAEENFLPASHGFITRHKWASSIRAFINLEACGAGGREVLFQAGPRQPWLLETYAEEVPYPYASSLAQEIFQSGVIPGDTDYRIFRDFGNVSGLDFAWSANGYVYHTRFDSLDQVPLGSLQRTGDNILALARGLAHGRELGRVDDSQDTADHIVFFDFLGAFVVRWSMTTADIVNIVTVLVSFAALYGNIKESRNVLTPSRYIKKVCYNVAATVGSWIMGILGALFVATLVTLLDRTMSWYSRPMWLIFLYVIPTVLLAMGTLLVHANYTHKDIDVWPWLRYQLYYDSCQLIWTIVLIIGIILRIRSSFIALLWVASSAISNLIKSRLFKKANITRNTNYWLLLHTATLGLPFVQSLYLLMGALYLFVPLMGRTGASVNAELLIAGIVSTLVSLQSCWVQPVAVVVREVSRVLNVLVGVVLLSVAALLLTPLGFPYSGGAVELDGGEGGGSVAVGPAPQRFMLCHTLQTIHHTNTTTTTHSGIWIIDMDMNSPASLRRHVPEIHASAVPVIGPDVTEECGRLLYCGMPYLVPVLTMYSHTHWLPAPPPPLLVEAREAAKRGGKSLVAVTEMRVVKREWLSGAVKVERLSFSVTGPSHIGVMLSPVNNVELVGWSLTSEPLLTSVKWNDRKQYFIFYSCGSEIVPFDFYLDFQVSENHTGHIIDMAVTSHHMFGPAKASSDFRRFIRQFPSWTAVSSWTATYDSWTI